MTDEALRRATYLQERSRASSNIKVGHLLALLGEGVWPVFMGHHESHESVRLSCIINQEYSDAYSAAAREKMGIIT